MATSIEGRLRQQGFRLRADFIESKRRSGFDGVLKAALNGDLRAIGEPQLPAGGLAERCVLSGPCVFQIIDSVDVSRSAADRAMQESEGTHGATRRRMLKLLLTDGSQEVVALEHTPCPALDAAMYGGKLALTNIVYRNGMLILHPSSVAVLGGFLAPLQLSADARRMKQRYDLLGTRAPLPQPIQAVLDTIGDGAVAAAPDAARASVAAVVAADVEGTDAPAAVASTTSVAVHPAVSPTSPSTRVAAAAAAPQQGVLLTQSSSLSQQQRRHSVSSARPSSRLNELLAANSTWSTLRHLSEPHSRPVVDVFGALTDVIEGLCIVNGRFSIKVLLDDGEVAIPVVVAHEVLASVFDVAAEDLVEIAERSIDDYTAIVTQVALHFAKMGPMLFRVRLVQGQGGNLVHEVTSMRSASGDDGRTSALLSSIESFLGIV